MQQINRLTLTAHTDLAARGSEIRRIFGFSNSI